MEKLAIDGGPPVRDSRKAANPRISEEAKAEVVDVLDRGDLARFYGGQHVQQFEREYADWFGRRYAVAVNSGTSALHVAYLSAGFDEFSEVLVPANAYISAISTLIQSHLVPVIVDIDPQSWVMDPEDVERKITSRTCAIVPVHMYGQTCAMDELSRIASANDLTVIEDCGQSHGALSANKLTGTFGLAACFSVCCRKHIAVGEGGIVITDSKDVADKCRAYAHKGKGQDWSDFRFMGFSYNMTEIQAVLGSHSLRNLEAELARRQGFASRAIDELQGLGLVFPKIPEGATHAYFKLNLLVPENLADQRDHIVEAISKENVGVNPSHPNVLDIRWLREQEPLFFRLLADERRPCYDPDVCPRAKNILRRQIGLELGPGLDEHDTEFTIKAVRKVIESYTH